MHHRSFWNDVWLNANAVDGTRRIRRGYGCDPMSIGDLVEVMTPTGAQAGIITSLSEPTPLQPIQIATVHLSDETREQYVTTILRAL